MFNRIAGRYDCLNRLLSLRRDVAWRNALVRALPEGRALRVLDLATGTGDVLLAMAGRKDLRGVGLDPATAMLAVGRKKLAQRGLSRRFPLIPGDALALPFAGASFDAVTIAFGIRNVPEVDTALGEMRRVLRPGGRLLVLEFSLPAFWGIRAPYLVYFRYILPRIGALLSGDGAAYRYLNRSVEAFPCGHAFCALLEAAGFTVSKVRTLSFGIATLYTAER